MTQPANESLCGALLGYDAFTDIEFNPEKSVSCQAAAAALLTGLNLGGLKLPLVAEPSVFRSLYGSSTARGAGEGLLF